jgi:hypothetical protein
MRNCTKSTIRFLMAGAGMAMLFSMAGTLARAADSGSVDAPVMGYVMRSVAAPHAVHTPELRAILGVAGAARFSEALPLPKGTLTADAAPGLAWVLLNRADGATAYQPGSQTAVALPVTGFAGSWAFSPSGARVALFYPDRNEVALVSGLPGSPQLDSTVKVAPFDSFAAGDNGGFVYASGNRVFTGNGQLLYAASGTLGPVAYEAGRDVIALFDGGPSSLMEVGLANAGAQAIAGNVGTPDRLFAAADRIYAGDSVAGKLSIVNTTDGSIASQSVRLTRILPSTVAGTMVVSCEASEPAWLVNAQGVSFVPALTGRAVAAQ